MEHACAATVVEAHSAEPNSQTTLLESTSRRKRILQIIAEIDTESQMARLRQLAIQGRWLEWTDAMLSGLSTCSEVDPTCPLWGRPTTLRHILNSSSACRVYRLIKGAWQHDSVYQVLQRHLASFWKHVKRDLLQDQAPFIWQVKEGSSTPSLSTA